MSFPSHYVPRSSAGWSSVIAFLALMALAQPPIVFWVDGYFEGVSVLGLPFLYVYLGVIYFALIGVLLWTLRMKV